MEDGRWRMEGGRWKDGEKKTGRESNRAIYKPTLPASGSKYADCMLPSRKSYIYTRMLGFVNMAAHTALRYPRLSIFLRRADLYS